MAINPDRKVLDLGAGIRKLANGHERCSRWPIRLQNFRHLSYRGFVTFLMVGEVFRICRGYPAPWAG